MLIPKAIREVAKENVKEEVDNFENLNSINKEEKIKLEYNKLLSIYRNWNKYLDQNKLIRFKLAAFSVDQQVMFISKIQKIVSSEYPLFNINQHKDVPNKQILKKLNNIDINIDWNELINQFVDDKYSDKRYLNKFIQLKENYRSLIRSNDNDLLISSRIEEFMTTDTNYISNDESDDHNIENLLFFTNVCMYIFEQVINYRVINNDKLRNTVKQDILKSLLDPVIAEPIIENREFTYRDNLMSEFIDFVRVYNFVNLHLGNLEVTSYLGDKGVALENGYADIIGKYKVEAQKDVNFKFREKLFMKLCFEQEDDQIKETVERFKKKISEVKETIRVLKKYNINDLQSFNTQHLKVVYRELFLDKNTYLGKQPRSILRNIKENEYKNFNSTKEYIFLRQKISRGLFREKGLLEHYFIKINAINLLEKHTLSILKNYTNPCVYNEVREYYLKLFNHVFKQINSVK